MATNQLPFRPRDGRPRSRRRDKLSSFFRSISRNNPSERQDSSLSHASSSVTEPAVLGNSDPDPQNVSSHAIREGMEHQPQYWSSQFEDGSTNQPQAHKASREPDAVDDMTQSQSWDLWERGFRTLKEREPDLVKDYEKQLASMTALGGNAVSPKLDPSLIEAVVRQKLDQRDARRLVFQVGKTSFQIRAIGEKIIETILWANTFIGTALSSQPYASLAWSGVSILLPLLLNNSKQNSEMIEGLEMITRLMQLYRIREELYISNAKDAAPPEFINTLVELYDSILEYEIRTICYLSRGAVGRGIDGTFGRNEWNALISKIQSADKQCIAFTVLFDIKREQHELALIADSTEIHRQILAMFQSFQDERQRNRQNDKESELLQSLASDYKSDKNYISERIDGTCEWFLEDERFINWHNSSTSSLLWVSAGPGCGKSVLAKALIDEKRLSKGVMTTTVCYFFFKDGQEHRMHGANALSGILHQLFSNPNLIVHGLPSHERLGSKLCTMFHDLWEIFLKAVEDPDAGEVICVIDALDECKEQSRQQFMDYLVHFFSSQKRIDDSSACVKFLVTSRPYDDLEFKFKNLSGCSSYVRFDGDDKSEQISREVNYVIDARVDTFASSFKLKDRLRIAKRLKETEHRTYLWLFLTFEIIEGAPAKYAKPSSIESLLADLPQQVFDAYEKLLSRSSDEKIAKKLLQIIVAARVPLTLRQANVMLTLATQNPKASSLDELDLWSQSNFASTVKNMCGLLVAVHDGRLSLLHQTARDFLIREQENNSTDKPEEWRGCVDLASAHSLLCQACVDYLTFRDFARSPRKLYRASSTNSNESTSDNGVTYESQSVCSNNSFLRSDSRYDEIERSYEDGMLEYAAKFWPYHDKNQDAKQRLRMRNTIEPLFDAKGQYFRHWVTLFNTEYSYSGQIHPRWNKSQVAAFLGMTDMVEKFLGEGEDVNALCIHPRHEQRSRTALLIASERGYTDVARCLLQKGANPTFQHTAYENAVTLASENGHIEILNLLFEYGLHVDWYSSEACTALQKAVHYHRLETIAFLLKRGASIHVPHQWYNSPLTEACRWGYLDTVKLFIESGTDLKAGGDESAPLHWAYAYGQKKLAEFLLSHGGCSIHSYSKKYGDALQAACYERDNTEIVKMLIEQGNNVNAGGGEYGSALNAACGNRNLDIVRVLIENGANVNADGGDYSSALNTACVHGNLDIVRVLIENGANVNADGGECGSALNTACAQNGNLDIVRMLVENGARVNLEGEGLTTPLHYASKARDVKVARFLLQSGANLEAVHVESGTPLQAACLSEYGPPSKRFLKLLIDCGSNVNASSGSYGTALQQISYGWLCSESSQLAQVLIEVGAGVNARASKYGSPLHCALRRGNRDLVKLLNLHRAVDIEGDEPDCCEAIEEYTNYWNDFESFRVEEEQQSRESMSSEEDRYSS